MFHEMWSDGGKKAHPHELWHVIDHHTGQVLASVFGRRKDKVFLRLQALLEPFDLTRYYTDGWGTYERYVDKEEGEYNYDRLVLFLFNLLTSGTCFGAFHVLQFG